jgi:hypothetical protein
MSRWRTIVRDAFHGGSIDGALCHSEHRELAVPDQRRLGKCWRFGCREVVFAVITGRETREIRDATERLGATL